MSALSTDVLTRVPPQNIEAEETLIGAIVVNGDLFEPVAEVTAEGDFYREAHRIIWSAMEALASARRPIDRVGLIEVLRPRLDEIGGIAHLTDLAAAGLEASGMPTRVLQHARIIREKSIHRQLAIFGMTTAGTAYEAPAQWSPDWTEEALVTAEYELATIASRAIRKPETKKADALSTVLWNLEHRVSRGVLTGFKTIDQSFGGFDRGHLTIEAARTSVGKTALALNIAKNVAETGQATVFFTLEQPAEEMWLQRLGLEAQVDTFAASRRGLWDDEKRQLQDAERKLKTLPFEILYRPSMRPRDLRIECRRLTRELGSIKLVVVDYLALMRGNHRERERWREMQEVVLALKEITGELGVPILLLQQLNRETNPNLPPSLSNLRDTGAAEEHASNVLFLWQEPPKADAPPAYGAWEEINVIIAKQRNGPAGLRIPMQFKKCWGAFSGK